jgi:hypothetical protein
MKSQLYSVGDLSHLMGTLILPYVELVEQGNFPTPEETRDSDQKHKALIVDLLIQLLYLIKARPNIKIKNSPTIVPKSVLVLEEKKVSKASIEARPELPERSYPKMKKGTHLFGSDIKPIKVKEDIRKPIKKRSNISDDDQMPKNYSPQLNLKSNRAQLTATSCKQCSKYYDGTGLNPKQIQALKQKCSRHRLLVNETRQDSPPALWEKVDFDEDWNNVTQTGPASPVKRRRRKLNK